jgi:hypothetical protein
MESIQIIEATPWEVPWRRQGSTDRGGGIGIEEETYDDRRLSDYSRNPKIRGEGVVKQSRTTWIAKHTMDDEEILWWQPLHNCTLHFDW